MNKAVKILVEVALFAVAVGLVVAIVKSVKEPVDFNKQTAFRSEQAVQNLKDIRTLQVAYKSVNNKFVSTVDSLVDFYNNGQMSIIMQVGSQDDSLAVAHTEALKKAKRGITAAQLYELYKAGDKHLVFSVETKINVKDTLFNGRENFDVNALKYIPYSDGELVEMEAITKTVSGVQVPLFEARMPYKKLLKGLNEQQRINLDDDCKQKNKYPGLQVGSISAPNNNAGNWE
ncbi:MAG: hypothetical protein K5984_04480 [Bacteroidales bacterium]|nr:hypothetical protein [Bacteroidales bacterium]